MTTQRLIRVLVYEGTPEWIADTLAHNGVKGSYTCPNGVIREAVVTLEDVVVKITPEQETTL